VRKKNDDKPRPGRKAAPPSDAPEPKAQRKFTDPESRILKTKDGYIQGYNAQAAVDAQEQIIVARSATTATIRRSSLHCSIGSRPTWVAIRARYRPMLAIARPPIFALSADGGSRVTSRPDDNSTETSPPPQSGGQSPARWSPG